MIAAAFVGALGGFLLWNVSKAQIFMGDSGSLALGGALVAFAIFTRTELLLPIIALVPVLEVFSVIVQKFVFKFSRKGSVSRGEKVPHAHRFFRMTPFHHHMEKTGVNGMYSIDKKGIAPGTVSSGEVNSVFRLWVVNALCVLIALALFFGDWFSQNTGVIN
jgi:phospho-N-acetylmuramoyl-pentapeptide-transferase